MHLLDQQRVRLRYTRWLPLQSPLRLCNLNPSSSSRLKSPKRFSFVLTTLMISGWPRIQTSLLQSIHSKRGNIAYPLTLDSYLPYDDDEGVPVHGEFKHIDPASRADPKMPNLLKEDVIVQNLTPILGTTISGVQLTRLSKASLDEVALLGRRRVCCRNSLTWFSKRRKEESSFSRTKISKTLVPRKPLRLDHTLVHCTSTLSCGTSKTLWICR